MLQLRVYGETATIAGVADRLDALTGTRHVTLSSAGRGDEAVVTADLRPQTADPALEMVRGLGIPAEDVALLQLDTISAEPDGGGPVALVYADLLGRARLNSRQAGRYLAFMAVAGVIAAFGVIDEDQVLIVGAMAVAPDLLPITAACTGLVLRRGRLVGRALLTVFVGLGLAGLFAAGVSGSLNLLELLPAHFALTETGIASQQHVNAETIGVAFAAGVAGMLALETRASAAVGVAISVTTIPASAFLGVAVGIGQLAKSVSALGVLAANVALMLIGGSLTLSFQRRMAARSPHGREEPDG